MKKESNRMTLELPTQEVLTQLAHDVRGRLSGRVHDFHLLIRDEGLVLRGRTHTYYAKQLAQHAVMEVAPRAIFANEIEVM